MNTIEHIIDQYVYVVLSYIHEQHPSLDALQLQQWYRDFKAKSSSTSNTSTLSTVNPVSQTCVHVFKRGKKMGETCSVIVKDGFDRCTKHRRVEDTPTPARPNITQETLTEDLNNIVSEDEEAEVEDEDVFVEHTLESEEEKVSNELEKEDEDEDEEDMEDEDENEDDDCEACEVEEDWQSERSGDEY